MPGPQPVALACGKLLLPTELRDGSWATPASSGSDVAWLAQDEIAALHLQRRETGTVRNCIPLRRHQRSTALSLSPPCGSLSWSQGMRRDEPAMKEPRAFS